MLVTKERDESDARQFLYKPTLLAISVIPMLVEMMVWGSENGNAKVDPEFKRRFKSDREALIAELQSAARESAGLHPR
jgi:DNA-binding HxlR family transcriptional regulator